MRHTDGRHSRLPATVSPVRFEYDPATLRYAPDAVRSLGTELDEQGDDRARSSVALPSVRRRP